MNESISLIISFRKRLLCRQTICDLFVVLKYEIVLNKGLVLLKLNCSFLQVCQLFAHFIPLLILTAGYKEAQTHPVVFQ